MEREERNLPRKKVAPVSRGGFLNFQRGLFLLRLALFLDRGLRGGQAGHRHAVG